MRKLAFALIAVAALCAAISYTPDVSAQNVPLFRGQMLRSVVENTSAVDGDIAIVVRYVGASCSGASTVAVAAGGDISFVACGSADTTVNTTGTIDCSTPPAGNDTLGEVVDLINASSNWRAVLLDGLRSDSSDNTLATLVAADAKPLTGQGLKFDSSNVTFTHSRALTTCRDASCLIPVPGAPTNYNPWKGTYTVLQNFAAKTTYSSGTSTINIYSVTPTSFSSETANLIYSVAGGNTTVEKSLSPSDWPMGLVGEPDAKIVLRVVNSAVMSAATSRAQGLLFRY